MADFEVKLSTASDTDIKLARDLLADGATDQKARQVCQALLALNDRVVEAIRQLKEMKRLAGQ